jgi:hypothetical protein
VAFEFVAQNPYTENVAFEAESVGLLSAGEEACRKELDSGQEVPGFNESDNDCFITVKAVLMERTHFSCS